MKENPEPAVAPFDEAKFIQEHNLTIVAGRTDVPNPVLKADITAALKDDVDRQFIADALNQARRYLGLKMIQDGFGTDHNARRQWRMEMVKKYGKPFIDFYQSDKMRGNKLAPIVMTMGVQLKVLKRLLPESSIKEKIASLQERVPDIRTYNTMSVEQKRELIAQVDAFIDEFIATLT